MTRFEASQSALYVQTSPRYRAMALWLTLLFGVCVIGLLLLPWRQTITGTGRLTAFAAGQRPQTVQAPIAGQIKQWFVQEGQPVGPGQIIAELADIDPKFLDNNQLQALQAQQTALRARRDATQARWQALQQQESALSASRAAAIPSAQQRVRQGEQAFTAARQALDAAQLNYRRIQELYDKGLRSRRDFELAELDRVRAETALQQAQAQVMSAQFDQGKVASDTLASVSGVSAASASAREAIAAIDSDLAKLGVEIATVQTRRQQRTVRAPAAGRIVRLLKLGSGETVSEGDVLATIVPTAQTPAVELSLSAWDAPLATPGRLVRLQFAGWPAIQFSGWPMIATGTFGGRVAVIDASDDGQGRYRVLVTPDMAAIRAGHDQPWPSPAFLRPGTEAHGWILLDNVPLGYELWRQFNAFPPGLQAPPAEGKANADKPVTRKAKK